MSTRILQNVTHIPLIFCKFSNNFPIENIYFAKKTTPKH